jgi:hypothetical protein
MAIITQTLRMIIREFLPEELDVYLNHFNDERVTLHIPKRTRDERATIFSIAQNQYNDTKTAVYGACLMPVPALSLVVACCGHLMRTRI